MAKMNILIQRALRSLFFAFFFGLLLLSTTAKAELSSAEKHIASTALEKFCVYERKHILLIWPENFQVNWYPESGVQRPEQLADWLEKCYVLCINWFNIDPNHQLNINKDSSLQARLIFIHNGMRDYNFGGRLPRPVIGLRNFSGVGSEDWFGWLTHELSHEFLMRFPEVVGSSENNAWHEALCDYLRYWLLKESGMPVAAENWRELLRRAPRTDHYKGGADIILNYHESKGCKSPADLWKLVRGQNFTTCFGKAPWQIKCNGEVPEGTAIIEFEGTIDGAGCFTFRGNKIYYEHFTWQYPTQVKINGKPWGDLNQPFDLGFTPVFASARTTDAYGRNTMVLIPHDNRMVLFLDDIENAASQYRMTIAVEKGSGL